MTPEPAFKEMEKEKMVSPLAMMRPVKVAANAQEKVADVASKDLSMAMSILEKQAKLPKNSEFVKMMG